MEAKIVSFKEISNPETNPTLCLSAKRYVGHCAACMQFRVSFKQYKTIEKTLQKMKCKPIITEEIIELLNKKSELVKNLESVTQQINSIDAEIQ